MKSLRRAPLIITAITLMLGSACAFTSFFSTLKSDLAEGLPNDSAVKEDPLENFVSISTLIPGDIPKDGVSTLVGEFQYSNEFYPEEYAYEHAVMLLDMTGFILRDREWEVPVESEVLGYVDMDLDANRGTFSLQLPLEPAGTMNDVDHDDMLDSGVQVFAVEYAPNWTGGPFYADDDPYKGWPGYLASVLTDSENEDEVIGGKLVVWAPDNRQEFPTGFGEDGLLFTDDDPLAVLPAGYSVINLDEDPFGITQDRITSLTLLEPQDAAVKDFSDLSYTEAFTRMFTIISKEYAFNGVEGKAPDWNTLYNELYPRIDTAEKQRDALAFYLALRDLTLAFHDGHVSIDGGDLGLDYIYSLIDSGYGFAVRELDDGRVVVVYVTSGSTADRAGIQVGMEITQFNGLSITDAISAVEPFSSQSTDYGLRTEQAQFLLRAPENKQADVTFLDLNGNQKTATLTSEREVESFFATYYSGFDDISPPVEYQIFPSGIGYIVIHSNSDDLNLAYRLFERALKIFKENDVDKLIIDMRVNAGGTNLGLAGYLTDEEIEMGKLEYYSEKTGRFEPEGEPSKITPMEEQFDFLKMVLLVDQTCYSACELESYGFSQVPGMTVMGQYPTGGVEAETARGRFILPEDIEVVVPTGRFLLPDGSIFLEGVGVVPDFKIPIDEESVLSDNDVVLGAAVDYLLNP